MNEKTMRVATDEGAIQVALEPDARFQVDGLPADRKAVVNKGGEVVIYPSGTYHHCLRADAVGMKYRQGIHYKMISVLPTGLHRKTKIR